MFFFLTGKMMWLLSADSGRDLAQMVLCFLIFELLRRCSQVLLRFDLSLDAMRVNVKFGMFRRCHVVLVVIVVYLFTSRKVIL